MAKRRKRKVKPTEPPSSDSEEDTNCRCICGSNDPNAKRPWIQCIACEAWQHNECMDRSVFSDELETEYLCEECHSDEHESLLDAAVRGQRPWLARVAERLAVTRGFERAILDVVESVEWFWPAYRPKLALSGAEGREIASKGGSDTLASAPPEEDYLHALRHALRLLFDELPVNKLRDLATECSSIPQSSMSPEAVMERLEQKARPLFKSEYARELGVLAEILRWVEKGEYWEGWEGVVERAGRDVGR